MYDQILIPYDGTDEAQRAAEHGIGLASALDATVHSLYVVDLPGVPRTLSIRDDEEEIRQEYRAFGEDVTGELCDMASNAGVECTSAIRTGSPSEEIVDYAEEEELDAIMIGSAYRGKLGGLVGGTMDKVVRASTIPVITTRMTVDD